ncbi:MAG TPA: hypothetical protein DEP72_08065 [Clostridiales bacterium]|nr:MAG: hypothetical protein A2Y18_01190 [Clostridiales bacterium GWD2_32_19]HCC08091.1 hypothetical protein [Clostridiales bacterium]
MNVVDVKADYFLKLTEYVAGQCGFNTREIYFYEDNEYIISNKTKITAFEWKVENSKYQLFDGVLDKLKNFLYIEENVFGKVYPYYLLFDESFKIEVISESQNILIENNIELYNRIIGICNFSN